MKSAHRARVKEKLNKKIKQLEIEIEKLKETLSAKEEELLELTYIQQVGDLADYLRKHKERGIRCPD